MKSKCKETFSSKKEIRAHQCHAGDLNGKFRCPESDKRWDSTRKLAKHLNKDREAQKSDHPVAKHIESGSLSKKYSTYEQQSLHRGP